MIHYGDIRSLYGWLVPSVDVIIGGSPCQNLSKAGTQEGFRGEQSVLFYEQMRVIKEMRQATNGKYPRFMVWENVVGAFSSNEGRDFRSVLTECARIAKPDAPDVPLPERGRWTKAGLLVGDGFSVAWRVLNAEFWGVPQRRRRIALIADFGEECAGEILFERESMSGDSSQVAVAGENPAGNRENDSYPAVYGLDEEFNCYPEKYGTLKAHKSGGVRNIVVDTVRKFARRLTPVEVERLQGFPDGYTDIGVWKDRRGISHKASDNARFQVLGNSITLPPWRWVLRRISERYDRVPTMGSLFDGIGGFSLLWTEINGKGTVLWGSEIDPFCEAISTARIP